MSVTERVMGVGSWTVELQPETPRRILAEIDPEGPWSFAQLVITDVPIPVGSMQDAGILAVARYAGVYRRLEGRSLSGAGLAAYLGDEDDKGNVYEAEVAGTYDAGGWASILTEWTGLTIKDVQPAGGWANAFRWVTARKALADVCAHYGHEWRITPDLGYRQGTPAYLYGVVPSLLIVTDDEGGSDWGLTGVHGTADRSVDVEDWAAKIIYLTERGDPAADPPVAPAWTVADRAHTRTDPLGRPLIMDALVEAHLEDGNPAALAAAELGKRTGRRSWTVEAGRLPRSLTVGAPVYVWAPDESVADPANPVYFRGRTLFPQRSRLMGATWPISPSMGVYLRRKRADAEWLDLTPYVAGETGGVQLEVGAVPRGLA
ncbi:MAG: hypothetical protein Q4F65_06920 [Propionibacteriaceae bacterium]|nr:hypothetical protein [Propionibacteriaceae bacterium]